MMLRRVRSLTTFGNLQYEETVSRYTSKLLNVKQQIDKIIYSAEEGVDLANIKVVINDIEKFLNKYELIAKEYELYLKNRRTLESANEESAHRLVTASLRAKVSAFIEHLKSLVPKTKSHGSQKSIKTGTISSGKSSSHLTAVLLQHTAKVEKAKARFKYAAEEAELIKQEAELIKQEAAIKASRAMLSVKRELEEAQSGLGAIRKVFDFSDRVTTDHTESQFNSYEPPQNLQNSHTARYVLENMNNVEPPPDTADKVVSARENVDAIDMLSNTHHNGEVKDTVKHTETVWNPDASPYHAYKQNDAADLAKLVAKNQLLPKRLWQFNDEPARYLAWKYSFMNVMEEISATELEQLDLLVNHLGPESRGQAENIRASNPRDPEKAVQDIWIRLDREYGSAETIELALKQRINNFPSLTDSDRKRYFDLSDLAAEVESVKCDSVFGSAFAYYDTSNGINDFVRKLPKRLREKWVIECDRYKVRNSVSQAPFSFFTKFLRDLARLRNDPNFMFDNIPMSTRSDNLHVSRLKPGISPRTLNRQTNVSIKKTEVETKLVSDSTNVRCPIHGNNSNHVLRDCFKFRNKSFKERKDYVFKNGYCLRCCGQKRHLRKNCREIVKCDVCGSSDHLSVLHPEFDSGNTNEGERPHEGEQTRVKSLCTEVCNTYYSSSKSCAKIVLVNVYPMDKQFRSRKVYCMIDDQSNKSLATSRFFDAFGESGNEIQYILSSCAGKCNASGRKTSRYVVQSLDNSCTLELPSLIECNDIPNNRDEIPSAVVANSYKHLNDIASYIPEVDKNAEIELLIGRDLISAHYVLDQRVGGDGLPYGQKLPLGWVIIGDVCLGKVHEPEQISVRKTSILTDGRPTYMRPCESEFFVKEDSVFQRIQGDEKPGLSIEDQKFLDIMETGFQKDSSGQWQAPLPFRECRPVLPDNKPLALRRAKSFDMNLKCNSNKLKQVVDFMENLLHSRHAETAPQLSTSQDPERWYLPMFSVYHPKKPESPYRL